MCMSQNQNEYKYWPHQLSKGPNDFKQIGTQEKEHFFSGTDSHKFPHGFLRFVVNKLQNSPLDWWKFFDSLSEASILIVLTDTHL